jgi:signal transduction histidine kinase
MLDAMTTDAPAGPRRSAMVAEAMVLVALYAVDIVLLLTATAVPTGLLAALLTPLTPALGLAVATMAVLRQRFERIVLIVSVVAGCSLLVSLLTWVSGLAGSAVRAEPAFAETVGLWLLVGSVLRRAYLRQALLAALLAGLACASAFPLRFGLGEPSLAAAIAGVAGWGVAVGLGLVLRDADRRRAVDLQAVRESERVAVAQELHDFVAHHISGIVVLAQGAQVRARTRPGSDEHVLQEIEHAGGEAMTAMRRLVGMLRTPAKGGGGSFREVLRDACGGGDDVRLRVDDKLVQLPAELVSVAHRVVLESVTNARRYAPAGTTVEVSAALERKGFTATLVIEVMNVAPDGPRRAGGYGLVGMAERVAAVGGTLDAGRESGERWLVRARIPLPSTSSWGEQTQ